MSLITERLAREYEVCNKATPGPWEWDRHDPGVVVSLADSTETEDGGYLHISRDSEHADAEFIATARTALPTALRALQAVMGLHKREVRTARMRYYCGRCGDSEGYPCPTIQAIREVYGDE